MSITKILQHPSIKKFLITHKINQAQALDYISEFKLYLANPNQYELSYDGNVILEQKKKKINPGLRYLEESYFLQPIMIEDIDYQKNPSKNHIIGKVLKLNGGYYLTGNNGVGKTFFALSLANHHFLNENETTLFVFWPDFIEKTKRFDKNNIHFINKVKYAKRLIIDDLAQESITAWSRDDILNAIIAYRLEKKLFTIITSNYDQQELLKVYTLKAIDAKKAKSIVNKIAALAPQFVIEGKNLRK